MSRLEKHIADYARAIEDMDGTRRAEEHLALCEHLGIGHDRFQPFENHAYDGPNKNLTRAQAAKAIRDEIERLRKNDACWEAWRTKQQESEKRGKVSNNGR